MGHIIIRYCVILLKTVQFVLFSPVSIEISIPLIDFINSFVVKVPTSPPSPYQAKTPNRIWTGADTKITQAILSSDWLEVSSSQWCHVITVTGNNMERGHDTDTQEVGDYITICYLAISVLKKVRIFFRAGI